MSQRTGDPSVFTLPRTGMLAAVRHRLGRITAVDPCDGGDQGRVHLVRVEYTDAGSDGSDELLWEREPRACILASTPLPDPMATAPRLARTLDAIVRATRWGAFAPLVDRDLAPLPVERRPLAAPFHAGVELRDFQLVPLLKALRMPRIALLLADDVGLGKTIEAGLILSELLIRRRIRRILIACPASLCQQWRQELADKFGLAFDIVDRDRTAALRSHQGQDANAWRCFDRIITSYHYLKRPEVLEAFRAACISPEESGHLPWDLLIVDEAHHLAPAPVGEECALARMLGFLSPLFEHRLFLTATPHNGHTRSFTGLLERLDPVRFTRSSEVPAVQRARIEEVVVRRLKGEINARCAPRPFVERSLQAIPLALGPRERALSQAFRSFRTRMRALFEAASAVDQSAGRFAVEVLGKRLLSCPLAFADSWHRYRQGLADQEGTDAAQVGAAGAAAIELTGDDQQAEVRLALAARVVGAWLKPFASRLAPEMRAVDAALEALGLGDLASCEDHESGDQVEAPPPHHCQGAPPPGPGRFPGESRCARPRPGIDGVQGPAAPGEAWSEAPLQSSEFTSIGTACPPVVEPIEDARFDALCALIDRSLRLPDGTFRGDERLVVFTEYKTTLDCIVARLARRDLGPGRLRVLLGGMRQAERASVLDSMTDPADPTRVLVATDAASEGLNLQATARLLLHFDVPWNPARLEQRNGRLDRHGQSRNVTVYHFATDDDADLSFLAHVVGKVHAIRDDLGSTGELFDAAFQRHLVEGAGTSTVPPDLDLRIGAARQHGLFPCDGSTEAAGEDGVPAQAQVERAAREIDLDAASLAETLEVASQMDEKGALPYARATVSRHGFDRNPGRGDGDDAARLTRGRPRAQTPLHLGDSQVREALAVLTRSRFSSIAFGGSASLWTVRVGTVPAGADALILLVIEELAANVARETVHHAVRTLRLPVVGGTLGAPLKEDAQSDSPVKVPSPHLCQGTLTRGERPPPGPGGFSGESRCARLRPEIHGVQGPAAPGEVWSEAPLQSQYSTRITPGEIPVRGGSPTSPEACSPPDGQDIVRAREIWHAVGAGVRHVVDAHARALDAAIDRALAQDRAAATERERQRFHDRAAELARLMRQQTLRRLEREIADLQADMAQGTLFDNACRVERLVRSRAEKAEELRRRKGHLEMLRGHLERERRRVLDRLIPRRFALRDRVCLLPVALEIRLPAMAVK